MSNQVSTIPATIAPAASRKLGPSEATLTFWEWCLRRETPGWPPKLRQLTLIAPALLACGIATAVWPYLRQVSMGREAIRELMFAAIFGVLGGGVQMASRAICWQISSEMRDLVRLTGINLRMLLWTTTLANWWTIGWSVVLLLPLAAFAITLGGVHFAQWMGIAYGLVLLAALTAGFGMLSSVLMANAKNHERATTTSTTIGLIVYNTMFSLASLAITFWNFLNPARYSSFLDTWGDRISQSAPSLSIRLALFSYPLFDPADPGYWVHFLTAILCAALATRLVDARFASSVETVSDGTPSFQKPKKSVRPSAHKADSIVPESALNSAAMPITVPVTESLSGRIRCTDRPFFWKDVYVLSEERRSVNVWSLFYCAAAVGVLLLGSISTDYSDRFRCTVMSVISLLWVGVIVALRFDALLTSEFRDRTWGTLMLLPVDPVHLLWTKLGAAIWEQRFVAIPTALAQLFVLAFGNPTHIGVAVMVSVFSLGVCGLLCQMSCINQLMNKAWWIGPLQALGCIGIIVVMVFVGSVIGDWAGAAASAMVLLSIVLFLQFACVVPLARNWLEP